MEGVAASSCLTNIVKKYSDDELNSKINYHQRGASLTKGLPSAAHTKGEGEGVREGRHRYGLARCLSAPLTWIIMLSPAAPPCSLVVIYCCLCYRSMDQHKMRKAPLTL